MGLQREQWCKDRGHSASALHHIYLNTKISTFVRLLHSCSLFYVIFFHIYFPATTAIAGSLQVSVQSTNFTITSYQIVSGIAPSIFATLADEVGRRPMLLLTLTLYLGANVGLALTQQYVALVVLRCLQSVGASSTYAIAYGIIADISIPADRGSFVGVLLGFTNAAPCLGPVIGGVVAEKLSWRWIFWLLAITSGSHLGVLAIFLPETCRKLVDNGSVRPAHAIHRSCYSLLCGRKYDREEPRSTPISINLLSPIKGLRTLYNKANFIVILVGGLQYTVFGSLASSLSAQVIHIYSMNNLTAGLTYLSAGLGGMLAALLTGRFLDYEFRLTARKYNIPLGSTGTAGVPIEKARLRPVFPVIAISSIATAGYGWALHSKTHVAIILVLQFFTGISQVFVFVTCGTLLTDFNPDKSSTVQASYNLIRCALSAAGIAAVDEMIRQMGAGWCFTTFSFFGALCAPLLYILKEKGGKWRLKAATVAQDLGEKNTS